MQTYATENTKDTERRQPVLSLCVLGGSLAFFAILAGLGALGGSLIVLRRSTKPGNRRTAKVAKNRRERQEKSGATENPEE
jgi:hypothetical protein